MLLYVSSSSAGYEALNYKVFHLPIEGIDLINDTNKELGFCKIAKIKDLSKLINHAKIKNINFENTTSKFSKII